MPAPYKDLAALLEDAEAQHTPAHEFILDTADRYQWPPAHTVAVLEAAGRHTRAARTAPSQWADIIATVDEFRADLDADTPPTLDSLAHAVEQWTSAAWAAAQHDDPDAPGALEHWAGVIAEHIGIDPAPIPDTDPVRRHLEAPITLDQFRTQIDNLTAI